MAMLHEYAGVCPCPKSSYSPGQSLLAVPYMLRSVHFLLLLWLLAIATATPLSAQSPPVYAGIDHVEFFVTDLQRSLRFYTQLFGQDLWKNRQTERRYLLLGSAYLALEERETARVDHVCFGIEPYAIDAVQHWLDLQELPWQDYPSGRDLRVDDRDGNRIQLAQHNSWVQLSQTTAAPEAWEDAAVPIFRPLAIDEIFLTVTNLEVDALFYARMLNQTGTLQAGSLWFNIGANARLRLTQAPVGQVPGLNYVAVLVSNTDLEAAAEAVFAAGGIIETILPNGFSFWDPDGHRVLVRTPEML